jgi:hypothetical protein
VFPRTLVTIDIRAAPDKHLSSNRIRNFLGRTHLPKRAGHSDIQQTAEYCAWVSGHDAAARAQGNKENDRYAGPGLYRVVEAGRDRP